MSAVGNPVIADRVRSVAAALTAPPPDIKRDKNGKPYVSLDNLVQVLLQDDTWYFRDKSTIAGGQRRHRLAYDVLRDDTVLLSPAPWPHDVIDPTQPLTAGPWTEADTQLLRLWFERYYGITVGAPLCESVVMIVSRRNRVDPVRSYLKGVVWDGIPRLDTWLTTYLGVADTPYSRAVGGKWLLSGVARSMDPGCKADHCLVLEGPQGAGKSSALSILGGAFYTDQITPLWKGDKDTSQDLRGKWLIEFAELSALSRSENESIKAFISRQCDNYRPSYGRKSRDFKRSCIFAATTNGSGYLKDETGARRFWPVRVGRIDLEALRQDRDQLWAEAMHRYQLRELEGRVDIRWWLTGEEVLWAQEEQEARANIDPWQPTIEVYLSGKTFVTMDDLLGEALRLPIERWTQIEKNRVSRCLERLEWDNARRRKDGKQVRGFEPKDVPGVPPTSSQPTPNPAQPNASESKDNFSSVPGVPGVPPTFLNEKESSHNYQKTPTQPGHPAQPSKGVQSRF